jgi:hypothetical protein
VSIQTSPHSAYPNGGGCFSLGIRLGFNQLLGNPVLNMALLSLGLLDYNHSFSPSIFLE